MNDKCLVCKRPVKDPVWLRPEKPDTSLRHNHDLWKGVGPVCESHARGREKGLDEVLEQAIVDFEWTAGHIDMPESGVWAVERSPRG